MSCEGAMDGECDTSVATDVWPHLCGREMVLDIHLDMQFADLAIEGRAIDTEQAGGLGLVSSRPAERGDNLVSHLLVFAS